MSNQQIVIIVKSTVNQGKLKQFKELTNQLINNTRKQPACLMYELNVNHQNPNEFWLVEKWKNSEGMKVHYQSEYFKRLIPKLNQIRKLNVVKAKPSL